MLLQQRESTSLQGLEPENLYVHDLQYPIFEVTEPRVPNLGARDCVCWHLRCSIFIRSQVKHERVQIVVFSPMWRGDIKKSSWGFSWPKLEMILLRVAVFTKRRLPPIVGPIRI